MSVLTDFYQSVDSDKLHAASELWDAAKQIAPDATEGFSYGFPALKLHDRPFVGFGINKQHLSIYPFSPKIIDALRPSLTDFSLSKGVIRYTVDNPLPIELLELVMTLRREQLEQ